MGKVLIGFFIVLLLFPFFRSQYVIIQAEHYEMDRYFKHDLKKKITVFSINLILLFISFFLKDYLLYILLLVSFLLNLFFINKEKIKYTKRIKRVMLIYFIISYIGYVCASLDIIHSFLLLNNLFVLLIIIIHYISLFIENIIMYKYIKEAKKIVKYIKIIGITGSYGKTSSKNIIYDMLENVCNVSKTPKSFNTKVGIVKSIRENVNPFDEFFICEYGVDKKNGMDKLLKIVKPNISLITEVGPQHLLTFKNINNIVNEKIKLAKVLKDDEVAVINNDNKYLNVIKKELKCKVITYGIENESNVMAKNINVTGEGSIFDLYIEDKFIKTIKIKLLGKHNVLNTLGAIGVLKAIDINLNNIENLLSKIKQVEHRLEIKKINDIKVIDDGFNSNEIGFKMAIDILNIMKEERIVITPGIIEQGENSNRVNFELGQYMADKIDFAILVEKNSLIIKEGLISKGFKEEKIVIKDNFLEAWELVKTFKEKENKIILIENDLPSIYLK